MAEIEQLPEMRADAERDCSPAERERIRAEYRRRDREIDPERYAPWQPAQMLMMTGAIRQAAAMLRQRGLFPQTGDRCLEVGFGARGWLPVLLSWGVREPDLCGIELDPERARRAQNLLPVADLRVGDAVQLPWPAASFRLVVASTVFTSILDPLVRRRMADEITRVLEPGGALLWYDFMVNNPANPQVRRVSTSELRTLFPGLDGQTVSATLAPPLARLVAGRSWTLATLLETIPWLRTHLVGVLVKR